MLGRQRRPNRQKTTGKIVKIPTGKNQDSKMSRIQNSVKIQTCQEQASSRESGSIDKDVDSKKRQGQTLAKDHAVDRRASQAVRRRSYRLSLVFIGPSLF
jgi:hypothetical protein